MGHIRAHSGLPGPLHEGNAFADALTKVIALNLHEKIDKAKNSHTIHYQNAADLRYEFHIPREAAKQIVKLYPNCPTSNPSLPLGVNPRSLRPDALWQMDVTHTRPLENCPLCMLPWIHFLMLLRPLLDQVKQQKM